MRGSTNRKYKKNQTEIVKLNNPITKLKNSVEQFNSITDQASRISKLEDRSIEIIQLDKLMEKECKVIKKAYVMYRTPLREIMYASLESQKEKKGRKEQKSYLYND